MAEGGKPNLYDFDKGDLEYKYATHFTLTTSPREFFLDLTCGQPDGSKPRCVARVILNEMTVQELLIIMNQQLQIFRKQKQGGGEGEQEPPIRR